MCGWVRKAKVYIAKLQIQHKMTYSVDKGGAQIYIPMHFYALPSMCEVTVAMQEVGGELTKYPILKLL